MNVCDVHALEELVKSSNLSYHENSVSWIFNCPRCAKRDKLYLRKRDGRFVCWHCATTIGYQGRPEFALRDLLGVSIAELRARLYGDGYEASEGSYVNVPAVADYFSDQDDVPEGLLPLKLMPFPLEFVPMDHVHAERAREYLAARGIDLGLAMEYGLHYNPVERRVIFPISVDGRLVGWQARTIEASEWWDEELQKKMRRPKILTPRGVDRERCLMFQDRLRGSSHAVLCEGPVDALKCHRVGGNVASMGKSVSTGQLALLRDYDVRRVYLALDPDAAAEITRLCRELSDLEVYLMKVPKPYSDFGEMSLAEVERAFLAAERVNAGFGFLPPAADFYSTLRGE